MRSSGRRDRGSSDGTTAREASLLFNATMGISILGILIGIFFAFSSIDLAVRVAAVFLVGIIGIISFFRHSVYYKSDQVRMGWRQEHPEFQLEVGYANLAIGIWALACGVLNWGTFACGLTLAIYGTYLLCTFFLHAYEAFGRDDLHHKEMRERAKRSTISTLFFVIVLFGFAFAAFARAGMIPFFAL